MTNISSYGLTSAFEEDISHLAAGTEIIGHPCTVWDLTVCIEDAVTAVVNFSNSTSTYDNSVRCGKAVIAGPGMQHIVFPKGLPVDGLCATANVGSVDVRVTYE